MIKKLTIIIDEITDNSDNTLTIKSHDSRGTNHTNIIGLISAPDKLNPTSKANLSYFKSYIASTVPPKPKVIYKAKKT